MKKEYNTVTELYNDILDTGHPDVYLFDQFMGTLFLNDISYFTALKSLLGIEKLTYHSIYLDERYKPDEIKNEINILNKSKIIWLVFQNTIPFKVEELCCIKHLKGISFETNNNTIQLRKNRLKYISNIKMLMSYGSK